MDTLLREQTSQKRGNKMNESVKKNRKRYSHEFKDQVLSRTKTEGVAQVARDLDLAESMIYYWRSQVKKSGTTLEQRKLEQGELARMQRELRKLKLENSRRGQVFFPAFASLSSASKRGEMVERILDPSSIYPSSIVELWIKMSELLILPGVKLKSKKSQDSFRHAGIFSDFGAPGRIRTSDHLVRSSSITP